MVTKTTLPRFTYGNRVWMVEIESDERTGTWDALQPFKTKKLAQEYVSSLKQFNPGDDCWRTRKYYREDKE
jgi:hypothetical protein